MDKLKSSKGITLIALVITIIILLILAGVTLNLVLNGGLIEKSQKAVDTYSEEQAKEKLLLDILEYKMKVISEDKNLDFGTYIGTKGGNVEKIDDKYKVTIYGYEFMLDTVTLEIEGGNKTLSEIISTQIIIKGNNLDGTEHGTITGRKYAYNNPVIPAGFETVETDLASWEDENEDGIIDGWNEGLVIQDAIGNQFVWVPVHSEEVIENGETIKAVSYEKWTGEKGIDYTKVTDDESAMPITIEEEITMIQEYEGFYIGRYEAGIPSTLSTAISTATETARNVEGTPVIKKNQVPWNLIRYAKISENAKKVCEKTNVKSGLLTGRMWDTTMKWMENSGINVTSNSAGWGNYRYASVENITEYSKNYGATWTYITSTTKESEDWLLKTGHTEYTNKKNIYDLAGNLMEIIAENYSNDYIVRGGYYKVRGSNDPAMYRGFVTGSGDATGFRVALFVQ